MRVVLVTTLARGGPLEHALVLARGLARRGVDVRAICASTGTCERFEAAGARAEPLVLGQGPDLAGARRLWRRLRGHDVVHAQDRRAGLWTRLAPRLRALTVYTVHGLPDAYLPPPAGPAAPSLRDRLAYEGIDAGLARRAHLVIVPSATLAQVLTSRLRFPPGRIRVIANGVEIPSAPAAGGCEVGTLSVLEPVKDLHTFLAAAELLARDRPELRFAVFGEGSQRAALARHARLLGLDDRLEMPGHVARGVAMRRLRVVVMPSLTETAPLGLLEAMAAGLPVVASRAGGIPEIAGEQTALLVAPRDVEGFAVAIARLLDDPSLAAARGAAGRERVRRCFSEDAFVDATLEAYRGAAASDG